MKMLTNNDKITVPQSVALMITVILETGLLSLPREAAVYANSDGWIVVFLGGGLAFIGSLAIGTLTRKFPEDTFVEYSKRLIGKGPGFILSIVIAIYFTIATSVVVRMFAEVINVYMLQKTPREFIIITQMLLTVYLIRHGIEPTARIAEIILPMLVIPVVAMYLIATPKADFSELLPILNTPIKGIALGSLSTVFSFFGIEILLMVGPYIRSPQRIYWTLFVSILASTMIYVFIVIVVFITIGVENSKLLLWPGMTIIRGIMAPGRVFERLDALALALWTIASFTTANGFYLTGVLTFAHITKAKEFKMFVTLLFPWIFLCATIPENILESLEWISVLKTCSLIIGVLVPFILLIIAVVRKKGGKVFEK